MFQTKNDHFKYGFNRIHKSIRTSSQDEWFVDFGRCEREPFSFFEEMKLSILDIRAQTDKTLYFLMSGGIDSEMMCNAALASNVNNIKFLFATFDDSNKHDFYYAKKWAKRNNIQFEFFNFSPVSFWHSDEAKELALRLVSICPQILAYTKLLEHVTIELNGVPIVGTGEFIVTHGPTEYSIYKREKILTHSRFLDIFNLEGIPTFYQYTPELMLAWLNDFAEFNRHQPLRHGDNSYRKIRYQIYQKYCPDLEIRPKFTGFEYFHESCHQIKSWMHSTLFEQIGICDAKAVIPYETAISKLKYDNI